MNLTHRQIHEICEVLNRRVQFYDEMGRIANISVIEEIKAHLSEVFAMLPIKQGYTSKQLADYLIGTSQPVTHAMQIFGVIGDAKVIEAELSDRITRGADGIWRCAESHLDIKETDA